MFDTPIQTVYTRSINDPIVASKLTGQFGSTNVAYIGARDNTSPLLLPSEESSELLQGGRSWSNIIRAMRTFPNNSNVGALVTDRRLDNGGAGSTVALDASLRFLTYYRVQSQLVLSQTVETNAQEVSEGLNAAGRDAGAFKILNAPADTHRRPLTPHRTIATCPSNRMMHRDKVAAFVREAEAAGISPWVAAPAHFRLLWRLGIDVPPPLFHRTAHLAFLEGALFGFFYGLFFLTMFTPGESLLCGLWVGLAFAWVAGTEYQLAKEGLDHIPQWDDYIPGFSLY